MSNHTNVVSATRVLHRHLIPEHIVKYTLERNLLNAIIVTKTLHLKIILKSC